MVNAILHWHNSLPATDMSETREREQTRQLERFLRDTERRALRMAELSVGSRDDALDLVQDAMLNFVRSYADRPVTEWPPLFYRVLDNRLLDHHRRNQVRGRWMAWWPFASSDEDEGEDAIERIEDTQNVAPLQGLVDGQTRERVERALRQLPQRQRQAFLLRLWEGLDVADTARAMSCSEGSVKTHLSRALAALRVQLEDCR